MWVSRDKNKTLMIWNNKPYRGNEVFIINRKSKPLEDGMEIDSSLFPSVTWENSPQEIEIKLVDNDTRE
jgi:hypothetical protein